MQPSLDGLRFVARAITPPGRVRRFDTRFFAAWRERRRGRAADGGPTNELEEIVWLPIAEAQQADIPLITRTVLQTWTRGCATIRTSRPAARCRSTGWSARASSATCSDPRYRSGRSCRQPGILTAAAFHGTGGRQSTIAIRDRAYDERQSDQRTKAARAYALAVDRRGDRLDQRRRHRHRARHAAAQRHPGNARPFGDDDRPEHGGRRPRLDRRRAAGHAAGDAVRRRLDDARDDRGRRASPSSASISRRRSGCGFRCGRSCTSR